MGQIGGITMNCALTLCIYQLNNKCTLDSIEIDETGSCSSCIYINTDYINLETIKEITIRDLNS